MMLIIFHSFTRKRADSVDLIGVLIPKLLYSYSASWQTLNFVYVFFTVLRMTTFFLFRTSPCSYNFPNSFWELFTSPKGLHICQQEYCFFCVISITGRDVDSQASLKMSELGQGLWFWSESSVEKRKGQPPGQTYRPKCCVWKNAPLFISFSYFLVPAERSDKMTPEEVPVGVTLTLKTISFGFFFLTIWFSETVGSFHNNTDSAESLMASQGSESLDGEWFKIFTCLFTRFIDFL